MALDIIIGIALLGSLVSLTNWRRGFYWLILLAALQDPLRKLTPGAPSSTLLMSTPIITIMVLSVLLKKGWWRQFRQIYPIVNNRFSWFLITCIPPTLISLTYSANSWLLTVFGIYAYGIFLAAIFLGYNFIQTPKDIRNLLSFYCLVSAIMLIGTYLEYFKIFPNWIVLGTKALDMEWVRYSGNYVVYMIAGFYRSPDIMGWHAASTSLLSFLLASSSKPSRRIFWLAICGLAIGALFFCGRRKMFYLIPFALIILFLIYSKSQNKSNLVNFFALILIPISFIIFTGNWLGDESTYVNYYKDNLADTTSQVKNHGFLSLLTTIQQSGFWGSGLGSASPGSHNLNIQDRPRVWQESGPSRIMMELGVPGFVALIMLLFALIQSGWSQVQLQLQTKSEMRYYGAGFLTFFLANLGSLVVSGQILADAFISCFLGFSIGIVLSLARFNTYNSHHPSPNYSYLDYYSFSPPTASEF